MISRVKGFVGGLAMGAGAVYALRSRRAGESRGESDTPVMRRYGARATDIAGLDAATLATGARQRTPPLAVALRIAGGALVLYSLRRRSPLRRMARVVGMALVTRGPWRVPAARSAASTVPVSERRRIVDVQKTFYLGVPLDEAYAFWSDYEHFPLFMSNVREVKDLGGGRSRWSLRSPGDAPIQWTAAMTEQQPNDVIAWRSEPGAMLENAGIVRFRPEGAGTRLDLRFCYRPLLETAGQAMVELLGPEPGAALNEDLTRLKTLLEATTRSGKYGEKSRS